MATLQAEKETVVKIGPIFIDREQKKSDVKTGGSDKKEEPEFEEEETWRDYEVRMEFLHNPPPKRVLG